MLPRLLTSVLKRPSAQTPDGRAAVGGGPRRLQTGDMASGVWYDARSRPKEHSRFTNGLASGRHLEFEVIDLDGRIAGHVLGAIIGQTLESKAGLPILYITALAADSERVFKWATLNLGAPNGLHICSRDADEVELDHGEAYVLKVERARLLKVADFPDWASGVQFGGLQAEAVPSVRRDADRVRERVTVRQPVARERAKAVDLEVRLGEGDGADEVVDERRAASPHRDAVDLRPPPLLDEVRVEPRLPPPAGAARAIDRHDRDAREREAPMRELENLRRDLMRDAAPPPHGGAGAFPGLPGGDWMGPPPAAGE